MVFTVLPRHVKIPNPFDDEIMRQVTITNLRINFTKLHTLGDNLLDPRREIQEKYYYGVYRLHASGTCLCYGHAKECIPMEGQARVPNMIHGRCDCKHNTDGLNCERCKDFYNDLPWKPAIGKLPNACKRCNCNNHASKCYFDEETFRLSGGVSGGVCEGCQHNTVGKNCESCQLYYYMHPDRNMTDPNVCVACECDPSGVTDDGRCDQKTDLVNAMLAGQCHCKQHVDGRRCDQCKPGYWNFQEQNPLGCEPCSCNINGTLFNAGCDPYSGACQCKRNVVGRDCDTCLDEHWGLSRDPEGCKPCDCDPGGAYDNNCNVITGQCRCRPNVVGRRCNKPDQEHFAGVMDFFLYEAEYADGSPDCQLLIKEPRRAGQETPWTGLGYMRVFEGSKLTFKVDDIQSDLNYDLVLRYVPGQPSDPSWEDVLVRVRPSTLPRGKCAGTGEEERRLTLRQGGTYEVAYPPLCLERGIDYEVTVEFRQQRPGGGGPGASVLIDSLALIPRADSLPFLSGPENQLKLAEFEGNRCGQIFYSASHTDIPESVAVILRGLDRRFVIPWEGSVTANHSSVAASVTAVFQEPTALDPKDALPVTATVLDPWTTSVSPRLVSVPVTKTLTEDSVIDVKRASGTFQIVNPAIATAMPQPVTPEPDIASTAETTPPDPSATDVCKAGTGILAWALTLNVDSALVLEPPVQDIPSPTAAISTQAGVAANPVRIITTGILMCLEEDVATAIAMETWICWHLGTAIPQPANANSASTYTEGFSCEHCKAGYYGDALQQNCKQCVCNSLGTNFDQGPCDRVTGQCPCFPNVLGLDCSQCAPNTWKLASGQGCEPCNCDPQGSYDSQCDVYFGQCRCKPGFGGKRCDECLPNFWGDPKRECFPCDCDPRGSVHDQCQKDTGQCVCLDGIGGEKCDRCARGYIGYSPTCSPCGECFENWDRVLAELADRTKAVVHAATELKSSGATGAYTKEFEEMDNKLQEKLDAVEQDVSNTTQRIFLITLGLTDIRGTIASLEDQAKNLETNATLLQEANVEGALNITRDAARRGREAQYRAEGMANVLRNAQQQRRRTESLLQNSGDRFNMSQEQNDLAIADLNRRLDEIEDEIPNINELVCDKRGDPCDGLCGGAGCKEGCGRGTSCGEGAVRKSSKALELAKEAAQLMNEKQSQIQKQRREVENTRVKADEAKSLARLSHNAAGIAKNTSSSVKEDILGLMEEIELFLNRRGATPEGIRTLAEEVLSMSISLDPQEIISLSSQINKTVSSLTNIDEIIEETQGDLNTAEKLKFRADRAKEAAEKVRDLARDVLKALEEAEQAQDEAKSAITTADGDIAIIRATLNHITAETNETKSKTRETQEEVRNLHDRAQELKKRFLTIEGNVREAAAVSEEASKEAEKAKQAAFKLEEEYKNTDTDLDQKQTTIASIAERAELLQQRANELVINVNSVRTQVTEISKEYDKYVEKKRGFDEELVDLHRRMDEYMIDITDQAARYRDCQPKV
ncbi:unnamed protein product [Cyprideis torosa]|uniref:Uncharacterized protein n=1 Tax=Cyprideis torosa TaxID=163714 RepID=A0A7R8ZL64_9CRUS|nr:unnamed protein product [Cyprideis torosa]CAG0885936.1 unnamed protein product [Cyprideis torosa]